MAKLGDENLSGKELLWELAKLARGPVPYFGNIVISELLKNIESGAELPKGILGALANPSNLAKDYVKTEATNQLTGNSYTSQLENLLNELRPSQFEQDRSAGATQESVPSAITAPDSVEPVNITLEQLYAILNGAQNQTDTSGSNTRSLASTTDLAPAGYTYNASTGVITPAETTAEASPPGYTFDANTSTVVPTATTPTTDTSTATPNGYTFDTNTGTVVPATDTTSLAPVGSAYDANLGVNVPATTTPSMPDYSRAYSALGGAEVVNNLRDQFLNMGLDENTIGSVFSNYYAPETGGGKLENFSYSQYRQGGQIRKGKR